MAVRRMTEPECVFGQLKKNRGFRRFLLRGIEKATPPVGWLPLAHNVLKQASVDQKSRAALLLLLENRCSARFFCRIERKKRCPIVRKTTSGTAPSAINLRHPVKLPYGKRKP
ncbi:transposase [Paenibacillus sp. NPDC057934]|uniref:transposase n=1 Tax=Paenibacillus sp. NPDC057934 TaxID=3346282 RepID=UPI0036D7BA94